MAFYYFDSSALAKRYVAEIGSGWVRTILFPSAGHRVHVSAITPVEVVAALSRRVRGRTLDPATGMAAIQMLRAELFRLSIVNVSAAIVASAMELAERHSLRGYDAVQLASALSVQSVAPSFHVTLVSADAELNTAAVAEGLTVDDPRHHP